MARVPPLPCRPRHPLANRHPLFFGDMDDDPVAVGAGASVGAGSTSADDYDHFANSLEAANSALGSARVDAALAGDVTDRWPALPVVVGHIRERQQHQKVSPGGLEMFALFMIIAGAA